MNEVKQIGNIVNTGNWDNPQRGRIYSADGICPALNTVGGGGLEPKVIEVNHTELPCIYDDRDKGFGIKTSDICPTQRAERGGLKVIVASRGRNKDNPSDRTPGAEFEQRLEPNSEGICNTLTSVQKDNLVLEPSILTPKRTEYGKAIRKDYENGKVQESRHNMTELQPRNDGISNTLTTVQKDNLLLEPQYRIRKLTPKECWRLMGFTDDDFHKAEKVNSNTQLYKQAGNSIVVEVLEGIFKQMLRRASE